MLPPKFPLLAFRKLAFLVVVLSTITACTSNALDRSAEANCTQPLFDLAYPFQATRSFDPTPIPFPNLWEPQLAEEQFFNKFAEIGDIVVRNDDEIWLTSPLMRFTPSKKELTEYSIKNEAEDEFSPFGLFLDKDNTLWALGNKYVSGNFLEGLYLSKYDENKDRFEIITDREGIFMSMRHPGMYDQMVEDQDGILWILFSQTLISFDPDTRHANKVLGIEQGYRISWHSIQVSSDGSIWLVTSLPNVENENSARFNNFVLRYDPKTGETREYGNPNNGAIFELFIDHLDRLWVHDLGWLDASEEENASWNLIIRSPVFITDYSVNRLQYGWAQSTPRLETLDQFIWFTYFNGLVRLDLDTNQWCLLTTLPVLSIAEDSQHNIWVASQGQIYKYAQQEP